jgi:hypothetical protein
LPAGAVHDRDLRGGPDWPIEWQPSFFHDQQFWFCAPSGGQKLVGANPVYEAPCLNVIEVINLLPGWHGHRHPGVQAMPGPPTIRAHRAASGLVHRCLYSYLSRRQYASANFVANGETLICSADAPGRGNITNVQLAIRMATDGVPSIEIQNCGLL